MYKVDISPAANSVLEEYTFRCANDSGTDCALRLLDSFDSKISYLESTPMLGCARLKYVPSKFLFIRFREHIDLNYILIILLLFNIWYQVIQIICDSI